MKEKRKDKMTVAHIAWFFDIMWIAVTGLALWLMISLQAGDERHPMEPMEIFGYVVISSAPVLLFIFLGFVNQAVVFDGQEIYTRNLYKVIRRVKWEDVTEIRKVKLAMNPLDPKILSWLMLIDKGGRQACKTSVNAKGDYIRVRATRKVLKWLEENHPDIPIKEVIASR